MKKFVNYLLFIGFILVLFGVCLYKKDDIQLFLKNIFNSNYKDVNIDKTNEYYRNYDFLFVQNTNNFIPNNKQELLNVYYTVINSGVESFTFYCGDEYKSCIMDVQSLANNQSTLSDINNYVHPFNSFSNIETSYDTLGKITINITKNYSDEDISLINNKVNELYLQLVNENDSLYNNILRVHDYIVNSVKYDSLRSDQGVINYRSDIAYGPLFEGYAICGGYTDLMQLFLEKMNVKSFRVSSDQHVWNALYYNNRWVNLDLTWDDPVISDGSEALEHNFFLIDTSKLQSIEKTEHYFDTNDYPELKEA